MIEIRHLLALYGSRFDSTLMYLSAIESGLRLVEFLLLPEMREHFSSLLEVEHEVQIRVVFEVKAKMYQEREVDRVQNALLRQRVIHLDNYVLSRLNSWPNMFDKDYICTSLKMPPCPSPGAF